MSMPVLTPPNRLPSHRALAAGIGLCQARQLTVLNAQQARFNPNRTGAVPD